MEVYNRFREQRYFLRVRPRNVKYAVKPENTKGYWFNCGTFQDLFDKKVARLHKKTKKNLGLRCAILLYIEYHGRDNKDIASSTGRIPVKWLIIFKIATKMAFMNHDFRFYLLRVMRDKKKNDRTDRLYEELMDSMLEQFCT